MKSLKSIIEVLKSKDEVDAVLITGSQSINEQKSYFLYELVSSFYNPKLYKIAYLKPTIAVFIYITNLSIVTGGILFVRNSIPFIIDLLILSNSPLMRNGIDYGFRCTKMSSGATK